MSDPPHLSSNDIRAQLDKHYRHERRHHLFAFHGTGEETTIDVDKAGRFSIVPVESELELREQLSRYPSLDARAAFLVPWNTEIPMDLRGRFAHRGKVLRVGATARLQRIFGVAEITDQARSSALASYLLATASNQTIKAPSGRLTESVLWETWLTARFGLDAPGGLALDTLLGWAAVDGRGGEFQEAMGRPEAAGLSAALRVYLAKTLGPAGPAVWAAWESSRGTDVLAWAVLCEGFEQHSEAAQLWVRQKLKSALDIDDTEHASRAASDLGRAVGGALTYFQHRTAPHDRRKLLAAADALVDEPSVRGALAGHRRLPSAWRARLDALGRALARGAEKPTSSELEECSDALDRLESHELFPEERETHAVKRALMAVRLLAWLVTRSDRQTEGQVAPHGDAVALATWYATEGGYIDWARGFARDSAAGDFGRGVQAVVEATDKVRAELDVRFATGLDAWVTAKRPSADVVPIDHALKRIAVPFLSGDDDRRLLVLLMDGMAWAQAVELLQSMGERAMAWGPLGWHGTTAGCIGSGPVPAILATLPTQTDVSRAAFFAGKAMKPGDKTSTAKDPARFEAHAQLRELCGDNTLPHLMLRTDGSTAGGAASEAALNLVGDPSRRVVGLVVNAIDASLKRDPQQHARWDVDAIRPLADLLDAAQRAGRAVLLASDHGHVPTELLTRIDSNGGSARWRKWEGETDELAEGELKFQGEGVWAPKGSEAVVLLASDKRYSKAPTAGEHGGVSLAEVVAPCLLIGSVANAQENGVGEDIAQRVVGAHVPDWWLLRVRDPLSADATGPKARPKKPRRPKKPDNQLQLLAIAPPEPEPEPEPTAAPGAARDLSRHPLTKSKLFTSLAKTKAAREPVLRAVEFLHASNGAATAEAFAAAMGELAWRVPGLISNLQGVLNVDGYQVLWFDQQGKQVRLDSVKLEQQFGVTL